MSGADRSQALDLGLFSLVMLLRQYGIHVEPEQISERFRSGPVGIPEIICCTKEFGLNANIRKTSWEPLARMPLPGIAALRGGSFLLVSKFAGNKVLVARQDSSNLEGMTREEFEAQWDGYFVVVRRRRSLSDLGRKFVRTFANIKQDKLTGLRQNSAASSQTIEHTDGGIAKGVENKNDDSGLAALVMLLRFLGIGVDAGQIRHRAGMSAIGTQEMLRCAKELGLKARVRKTNWERLTQTPLPGIAVLNGGQFLLLGKFVEGKVLVQHPLSPRPELMTQAQFEAVWNGQLVLMARRASLSNLSRRFDITWFLGAHPQISPPARRGAGRLVLPAAVCTGLAAVLPGRHRQGAGASQHEHARCAGHRPCRYRGVRERCWDPAHLSVRAHHQPHRRRTRRAPVPPSAGVADRLFPGAARRRFGGAGARTGEHPQFPDQLGADAGHRSVLHLRVPGGDVLSIRRC